MMNEKMYAGITDEKEMSAIDQIKFEFKSRYGVDVNISLAVHDHWGANTHITEDLANQIVSDWGKPTHHIGDNVDFNWCNNSRDMNKEVNITVFYPKVKDND